MSSPSNYPGGIASAMNDQRGREPAAAAIAGDGVTDPAELARIINLIRAAESSDTNRPREVSVGRSEERRVGKEC